MFNTLPNNSFCECHSRLSGIFLKKDSVQVRMTKEKGFRTSRNDLKIKKGMRLDFFGLFVFMVTIIFSLGCTATTPMTQPSQPHYTFTGSGGKTTGPLKITRIELNFQNERGEITVPMNSKLRAYAIIRFDGNGLFRATWEVDGRTLEEVAINVTFGDTLTLWTGPGTVLPTFEPGPHSITLRVKEPTPGFKIPVIRYFVTGEKTKE